MDLVLNLRLSIQLTAQYLDIIWNLVCKQRWRKGLCCVVEEIDLFGINYYLRLYLGLDTSILLRVWLYWIESNYFTIVGCLSYKNVILLQAHLLFKLCNVWLLQISLGLLINHNGLWLYCFMWDFIWWTFHFLQLFFNLS